MKPEQQPISVHERRVRRAFWEGVATFLVLGYLMYFVARSVVPPEWALVLIDALKPTLGALNTAERVSKVPFPAQVVIVYCAFGSIILTAWFICWVLLLQESREIARQKLAAKRMSRMWSVSSALLMLIFFFYLPIWALTHEPTHIDWRDVAFFSPHLGSVSFQLISYALWPYMFPATLSLLWFGLTWRRTNS